MAKIKHAPICLVIMDGWGIGDVQDKYNAIQVGNTPILDELMKKYPTAQLQASGEFVGLPDGQMGNSEVGHMNIGASRSRKLQNLFATGIFSQTKLLSELPIKLKQAAERCICSGFFRRAAFTVTRNTFTLC